MWKPCFPGGMPTSSACTCTPSAPGVNVAVPLTLLPAVACSTEMPFDDAADFAAGVCASANKPANDASTSPIKEALKKFMSAFVFRAGRHVQPHQCLTEHAVVEAEVRSN